MSPFEILNKLMISAVFTNTPVNDSPIGIVYHFKGQDDWVNFVDEDKAETFDKLTTSLHQVNKGICKNFDLWTFQTLLAKYLSSLHSKNIKCDIQAWNNFLNQLQGMPDVTANIMIPIYGLGLSGSEFSLGNFKVYSKNALLEKYPEKKNEINATMQNEFYLSIELTSKDVLSSRKQADQLFKIFEDVLNFVIGFLHRSIFISTESDAKKAFQTQFVFHNNQFLRGGQNVAGGAVFTIDKTATKFQDNFKYPLLTWITAQNKNDLQIKMLQAAVWLGRANTETQLERALIQYVIAWEILFVFKESGFISESITSQMCDNIGFLLAETKDDRLYFVNKLKKIYELRGDVVHGSSKKLSKSWLNECAWISNQIFSKLLSKEFCDCTSKKQVLEILKMRKYI